MSCLLVLNSPRCCSSAEGPHAQGRFGKGRFWLRCLCRVPEQQCSGSCAMGKDEGSGSKGLKAPGAKLCSDRAAANGVGASASSEQPQNPGPWQALRIPWFRGDAAVAELLHFLQHGACCPCPWVRLSEEPSGPVQEGRHSWEVTALAEAT